MRNKNVLRNRNKLIHGVGVNDADYQVSELIGGVRCICPIYAKWSEMLRRCYSVKHQAKHPTYKGCEVVKEWHVFSEFRAWMLTQDHEGKELDKDILVPWNKVYGPDRCLLVAPPINRLLEDSRATRGEYPIGVSFYKRRGKFMSKGRLDNRTAFFGYFDSPEGAHRAYCRAKSMHVMSVAIRQTDARVRSALVRWSEIIGTGEAYADRK